MINRCLRELFSVQGYNERLPLPKPIIEYILLLDIIEKEHAQIMYDYFSGRKTLKMVCVTKGKTTLNGQVYGKCADCQASKNEKVKRQKEREEIQKWSREFLEQCPNWHGQPEDTG